MDHSQKPAQLLQDSCIGCFISKISTASEYFIQKKSGRIPSFPGKPSYLISVRKRYRESSVNQMSGEKEKRL